METWDAITSRRNVREFADRPISEDDLDRILEAGRRAHSAATVVVLLPDLDDADRRARASFDVGQAAMQMMIAAADLGIGSGHSAVGDQDAARAILGFPEDRYAYIMVDFGYPADRPLRPIRRPDRRRFEEVVHRERW